MNRILNILLWSAITLATITAYYSPQLILTQLNDNRKCQKANTRIFELDKAYEKTNCFSFPLAQEHKVKELETYRIPSAFEMPYPTESNFSSDLPARIQKKLNGDGLTVYVDTHPDAVGKTTEEERGNVYPSNHQYLPLYIQNNLDQAISYQTYAGDRLFLTLEAKNKNGEWQEISDRPLIRCGNSIRKRQLEPKGYLISRTAIKPGNHEAELRIKSSFGTSNVFVASIDPSVFEVKPI